MHRSSTPGRAATDLPSLRQPLRHTVAGNVSPVAERPEPADADRHYTDAQAPRGADTVFPLDVAPDHSTASLAVARTRTDGAARRR